MSFIALVVYSDANVLKAIQAAIDKVNLKAVSNAQKIQVKRFKKPLMKCSNKKEHLFKCNQLPHLLALLNILVLSYNIERLVI